MVTLQRLTDENDPRFLRAMTVYKESFPFHEQRTFDSQRAILHCAEYHFDLIEEDGEPRGAILFWETADFIYVEHFFIFPEWRGGGIGSRTLEVLKSRGKTVILEIDPPRDEVSVRRLGFYERAGFCKNAYSHVHPPYHIGAAGHELVVMTAPAPIDKNRYDAFAAYLKDVVMGQ